MTGTITTPAGGVGVLRWTEPALPASATILMAEAVAAGHRWASTFEREWIARPFVEDGEGLFLAIANDDPVAMAAISADPFTEDRGVGRLRYIYVRDAFQRRGIAEHLLRECLARGGDRWRVLRLHTDNQAAARLYGRYGFLPSTADARATHVLVR